MTEKMNDISRDIRPGIPRVFRRLVLHLAVDLADRPVINVDRQGKVVGGWLDALFIDDSCQTETETTPPHRQHYCRGDRSDCGRAAGARPFCGSAGRMKGHWRSETGAVRLSPAEDGQGDRLFGSEIRHQERGRSDGRRLLAPWPRALPVLAVPRVAPVSPSPRPSGVRRSLPLRLERNTRSRGRGCCSGLSSLFLFNFHPSCGDLAA